MKLILFLSLALCGGLLSSAENNNIDGNEYVPIDVSKGNVKLTKEGYTIGDVFTESSGPYLLTTPSTTTNLVEVIGGTKQDPLVISLNNVNIDRWNVRVDGMPMNNGMSIISGYVNMILSGENNIRAGHDGAGIWLPDEATLRISGDGKLVAKAGSTANGAWLAGAGIGGSKESGSVGTLIIDSGSVYGYGILGSAGFGSGSVWTYTDTYSENHGVLILNGGDAHFFGNPDKKNNTIAIPEGIGCAGNVPTLVYKNEGTLEATLKEGTPLITNGLEYHQYIQPGLPAGKKYTLHNHLGYDEYSTSTDTHGNLFYWLSDDQTRKDVTGYDYVVELYMDKTGYGNVAGADFYNDGDEAEISFTWNRGNHDFKCWDNDETDNPYRFTVTRDTRLTAILEPNELRAWRIEIAEDPITGNQSETECCVYSFDGSGFDVISVLEMPSSFEIGGKVYTTTVVGAGLEGYFSVDLTNTLDNFIMPATITSVSTYLGRVKATVFTCLATTPPAILKDRFRPDEGEKGFYDVKEDAILRVPFGTADSYREAAGWKQFKNIEEMRPADEQWIINLHSDTEAYICGYAHPEDFSKDVLAIPSVVDKDGSTYNVTSIGHPETGKINLQVGYNLTSLVIPESAKKVTSYLFGINEARSTSGLDNLSSVVCHATVPPVLIDVDGLNSFSKIPANATLIVPKGTKQLYEVAPGWKDFEISEDNTTGVNAVPEDESAEKEYYRIDGTRANTLTPGLYIVRRGNSAHKVIIY